MSERYKYVWHNIETGKFTDSWPEISITPEIAATLVSAEKSANDNTQWRLIKYCCLSDELFEFGDTWFNNL